MHKSFLQRIRHEKELLGNRLHLVTGFGSTQGVGCCGGNPPPRKIPERLVAFEIPTDAKISIYDWIPACSPDPNDFFFGVNRSADPYRLSGTRVYVGGLSPKEGIIYAAKENFLNGGAATHCALNANEYFMLAQELGYPIVESVQLDIDVPSPLRRITCFPDLSIRPGDGFLVQLDTWTLYERSNGEFEGDGLLVCEAPGYNTRITF